MVTGGRGAEVGEEAAGFARVRGGQRGALRLGFGRRGGRTVLVDRRASAPFGAVRANYPDGSGMPEVQITNPAGGRADPGRELGVRGEEASQETVLRVGEDASLEYLPHYLIPYAGSNHRQKTTIHLARDATLLAWDAFSAGRVARGERFAFGRLRARTSIFRGEVPGAIDGLDLAGGHEHFGGYSYSAAAYVSAVWDLGPLAEELHGYLAGLPGVFASASAPGLCAVRVLTTGAPELYRALNGARKLFRTSFGFPAPAREVV